MSVLLSHTNFKENGIKDNLYLSVCDKIYWILPLLLDLLIDGNSGCDGSFKTEFIFLEQQILNRSLNVSGTWPKSLDERLIREFNLFFCFSFVFPPHPIIQKVKMLSIVDL